MGLEVGLRMTHQGWRPNMYIMCIYKRKIKYRGFKLIRIVQNFLKKTKQKSVWMFKNFFISKFSPSRHLNRIMSSLWVERTIKTQNKTEKGKKEDSKTKKDMTLKLKKKTIKIKQSNKYIQKKTQWKREDKEKRVYQVRCRITPKL